MSRRGRVPALLLAGALAFCSRGASAAEADLTTVPLGQGLPVVVRVGVYFATVDQLDESEETFHGTIDLRLRWKDARLRYPAETTPKGFQDLRGESAERRLAQIWSPQIATANLREESHRAESLRIYPDGRVELMRRTIGTFAMPFDVERFPFDQQKLLVELVSRRDSQEAVTLDFRQEDVDFSRASPEVKLAGWQAGLVELERDPEPGWYGEKHSRLKVALRLQRRMGTSIAPIFIPLLASLLIPLTAIWMNKVENGSFAIEAFELANVIIGGLFAVIALNFTVNAEYSTLGSGDNTVTRLFGLNYLTLAIALAINIALFRFNLVKRAFGAYVQEQLYYFLVWAVPLLVGATALSLLLVAMA
jgi:hypothetical protein